MNIATKPSKRRRYPDAPRSVEVTSAKLHARIKNASGPVLLTRNGRATAVAVDLKHYRRMLARVEKLETIEAIRRGLESAERGETRPWEIVEADLRKKIGLPSRRYRASRG